VAERRQAVAFLGSDDVARMLALPEGVRVVAIRDDFVRDGVRVLVEGELFDSLEPGMEAPRWEVSRCDPSALARTAPVCSLWLQDGSALEVRCPVPPCSWSREWEHEYVTPDVIAEIVQQHLNEVHPAP
jgi:hypothetical protein